METLDIVKAAVAALEDKKAEDVTVIDITGAFVVKHPKAFIFQQLC